jgi:hypothetical protein
MKGFLDKTTDPKKFGTLDSHLASEVAKFLVMMLKMMEARFQLESVLIFMSIMFTYQVEALNPKLELQSRLRTVGSKFACWGLKGTPEFFARGMVCTI